MSSPAAGKAGHARIINVGGVPSFILKPRLEFEKKLDFTERYSGMHVAFDTVHAKTLLTEVFADRLASQGIDVNAFHPGTVKSDMGRNMSFPISVVFKVANVFMSNTSKTGIHLATSDDVTGMTGQIFVGKKPRPLNFDQGYKDRLWTVTEQMIEQALA